MSSVIEFDPEGVVTTPQVRLRPEVARYAGLGDLDILTSEPNEVLHVLHAAEQAIYAKGRGSLLDTNDIELLQHIEEQRQVVRLLADVDSYDLAVQEPPPPLAGPAPAADVAASHSRSRRPSRTATLGRDELWSATWAAATTLSNAPGDTDAALAARRTGQTVLRTMERMSTTQQPITPWHASVFRDVIRWTERYLTVNGLPSQAGA